MISTKRIICLLLLVSALPCLAQKRSSDFGISAGGIMPICDYTDMKPLQSTGLDLGVFYRYNFNNRFALRLNGMYGTAKGEGSVLEVPAKFKKSVLNLSANIEFNYFEFELGVKGKSITPYVYTGIGMLSYAGKNGQTSISPTIPIGLGGKLSLTKHWGVGLEASLNKNFNDELDNLSDPYADLGLPNVTDNWHNNDWIAYFGTTIFFRFDHNQTACPAYDNTY